jgi:hypothetical protein
LLVPFELFSASTFRFCASSALAFVSLSDSLKIALENNSNRRTSILPEKTSKTCRNVHLGGGLISGSSEEKTGGETKIAAAVGNPLGFN